MKWLRKNRAVAFFPSGGPSAPGRRFPPEAPAEGGRRRQNVWPPVVASSSTPHFAAAPRLMLLAYGAEQGATIRRALINLF